MAVAERSQLLQARVKPAAKDLVVKAAQKRDVAVSDYIRSVIVEQAEREVQGAEQDILLLTANEQRQLWEMLDVDCEINEGQVKLAKLMNGEA